MCNNKQYDKKRRIQIETVFFLPMLHLQVVQKFHFFNFQKRKEEKNSALRGRDERIIPSPHTGSLSPSPHSLFPSHLFPYTLIYNMSINKRPLYPHTHDENTRLLCTHTHVASCAETRRFVFPHDAFCFSFPPPPPLGDGDRSAAESARSAATNLYHSQQQAGVAQCHRA